MAIPSDKKEQAIYHTILSDLHRVQAGLMNMQTLNDPDTAEGIREHYAREQSVTLGRLTEWRHRRPELHRAAQEDFQRFIQGNAD